MCGIIHEKLNGDVLATTKTEAILSPNHPFEGIAQLRGRRNRFVGKNPCLKNDGEDLVGRWIRLGHDAPHPELVEYFEKCLAVALLQSSVELA